MWLGLLAHLIHQVCDIVGTLRTRLVAHEMGCLLYASPSQVLCDSYLSKTFCCTLFSIASCALSSRVGLCILTYDAYKRNLFVLDFNMFR